MDDIYRMKVKIGSHEFEAEGPTETVKEQFNVFKELIESSAAKISSPISTVTPPSTTQQKFPSPPNVFDFLEKITKFDDERGVVSLTVRPKSVEDAVLIILLGQKEFQSNEAVTGAEIMDGLTATGGLAVSRVDRLLEKVGKAGDVIVIGERRSKRYRLTNAGINRAAKIAEELWILVP